MNTEFSQEGVVNELDSLVLANYQHSKRQITQKLVGDIHSLHFSLILKEIREGLVPPVYQQLEISKHRDEAISENRR